MVYTTNRGNQNYIFKIDKSGSEWTEVTPLNNNIYSKLINTNLNTIKNHGLYYVDNSCTNTPCDGAESSNSKYGFLFVIDCRGSQCIQTFFGTTFANDFNVYTRICYNGTAFSSWKKVTS